MITAWGMGCNILMNVGPTPEGIIPEDSAKRLLEIGSWLKTYGESIYGSTAGPFSFVPWGTATRKGDTVYLQIFQWPTDGKLRIPLTNEIKSATLLGTEKKEDLKFSRENGRLVIQLPEKAPDAVANVVALKVEGEPISDYHSLILNKPVKASSGQATAAKAVDEKESYWECEHSTGWLEIDAGTPVTVGVLRLQGSNIKKSSLEYKSGIEWKPIFTGEKFGGGRMVQSKEFSPVTARYFRFSVTESDKQNPQIRDLELYPPL
jgi:alpha-L-fucosidase